MPRCSLRLLIIRPAASVLLIGLLGAVAAAAQVEMVPVRDAAWTQSLTGEWKFKYEAGAPTATAAAFPTPDFADGAWQNLTVPAHWELHGFAEPKYAKVDEGNGYYRRHFRVPAGWAGRRVLLRFEGVLYGLEAWVNGKRVGEWASSYNPVTFDITDAVKRDADNVVAVHVSTHPKGWEFDTNDCWALSGIYREVTLCAVPETYLRHYTARTHLLPGGNARLELGVATAGAAGEASVRARLTAPDGTMVGETTFALRDHAGSAGLDIAKAALWSAETPRLYSLDLQLLRDGRVVQQTRERIGVREVSIANGVLRLNGVPVKLRGVDHHDIWPEEGRVATEERIRQDLELIRAGNANFIRTSHYPPHPRLPELCDELGLYLMVEVPFGFGDAHLTDPSYQDILYTRARATVLRDENHPSVIVWSVGNENPNTALTFATGKRVKELDPTRPICFPQVGSYFARSHQELPDWVDIYAPHYPSLETVKSYAQELTRPVIFTEYAHGLGLTGEEVQAEWPVMQASPHLAGGAIWMFQDQGILRPAAAVTDPEAARLAVYPDRDHAYDTHADQGMDGVVYSDRRPQAEYWLMRKVYSPLQIPGRRLRVAPGEQPVELPVQNRFDFRDLKGVTLGWTLRRNGTTLQQGEVPLSAPAHTTEQVRMALTIPADAARDLLTLELQCRERGATPFYERTIQLEVDEAAKSLERAASGGRLDGVVLAELRNGRVDVEDDGHSIRVRHPLGQVIVDRTTGTMTWLNRSGKELATGPYPHTGRRFTQGERMRQKREQTWPGSYLERAERVTIETHRSEDGGFTITVKGRYARPDDPKQGLAGAHTVNIRPNGSAEVTYDYRFVDAKGVVLEAGLSFLAPSSATELRWIGDGPHPAYPDKDLLDEFGVYHLNREDLEFQGNRRGVELALLAAADGSALALAGTGMDVAVEREEDRTLFSHNALITGVGGKGGGAETQVWAEKTPAITGRFTVVPLDTNWPGSVQRWLGVPAKTVPAVHPYYRSYDQ